MPRRMDTKSGIFHFKERACYVLMLLQQEAQKRHKKIMERVEDMYARIGIT